MTSRLTVSALVFSLLATFAMVCTAEATTTPASASPVRVVQLERVVVVAHRA